MNKVILPAVVMVTVATVAVFEISSEDAGPKVALLPPLLKSMAPPPQAPRIVKISAQESLPLADPKEAERRWRRLNGWVRCYEGRVCELPENDSRARDFVIRDAVVAEMEWFSSHRVPDGNQAKAYASAAVLLRLPEEQVQSAALRWLLQLPPNPETLGLLQENLGDMVDPELARLTVLELQRHMGTPTEGAAMDLAERFLFEGGIFASREFARSLVLLRYEGNQDRFDRWLGDLPPRSAKRRLLEESLHRQNPVKQQVGT